MRKIETELIKEKIIESLLEINCTLPKEVKESIDKSIEREESPIARDILGEISKNVDIAHRDNIPICQDTGMVIVYVQIGQGVILEGEFIGNTIQDGIREAYSKGYFRKSIVSDPIDRVNTLDNTPGIIHYEIIEGDKMNITVMAKGFGSENMSQLAMLKPSDGIEGIKEFIINTINKAGGNACPPLFVGVGIGGDFEKSAILAKKALAREKGTDNMGKYKSLEKEILDCINSLGIGPMGMGGRITALEVNIESFPTHIAGLPVAVNICCHVNRHKNITI